MFKNEKPLLNRRAAMDGEVASDNFTRQPTHKSELEQISKITLDTYGMR